MSGTKTTRAKDATIARLLEQCEHADFFRFEVPGAPPITIHVEPDGMGRWAVTRYGWVEVCALTADGWQRFADLSLDQRFVWPLPTVLDAIPGLLASLDADHREWKQRREQAKRAAALAEVVEEQLQPVRRFVSMMKAGAA